MVQRGRLSARSGASRMPGGARWKEGEDDAATGGTRRTSQRVAAAEISFRSCDGRASRHNTRPDAAASWSRRDAAMLNRDPSAITTPTPGERSDRSMAHRRAASSGGSIKTDAASRLDPPDPAAPTGTSSKSSRGYGQQDRPIQTMRDEAIPSDCPSAARARCTRRQSGGDHGARRSAEIGGEIPWSQEPDTPKHSCTTPRARGRTSSNGKEDGADSRETVAKEPEMEGEAAEESAPRAS